MRWSVPRFAPSREVYDDAPFFDVRKEWEERIVDRFCAAAAARDEQNFFSLRDAQRAPRLTAVTTEKFLADGHPDKFAEA